MSTSGNNVRRRRRRGNGVLEAALVLPVLMAMSLGMVEFGQFFYMKHSIQGASRDGARRAILGSTTHTNASNAVKNAMTAAGVTDATKYKVAFQNAQTSASITDVAAVTKGTAIKVTVTATAGAVSVRPLGIIPASKAIVGTTTMIKE